MQAISRGPALLPEHPPEYVQATAAEILSLFKDQYRHACEFDCATLPDIDLNFSSTVADWRHACDLVSWRPLAKALNAEFGLSQPMERWRAVLEPSNQRTLGEVCEFIASSGARVQRIRSATLLGRACSTAGAFLTVRSLLQQAGADVSQLTPSSELEEYARRYPAVFVAQVSALAPGKLPAVKIRTPLQDACLVGVLLALGVMILGHWLSPFVTIAGVLLFGASYAGMWIATRVVPPREVSFGKLRTFRDLARVLMEESEQV